MPTCNHLLPTFDSHLTPDRELCECLLPEYHPGEHLCQLQDGRFLLWSPMREPCDSCPAEYCECFDYQIL